MNNAICPISDVKCNEYATRVVSFLMMTGIVTFLLTGFYWILVFLSVDFFLRCFLRIPHSPVSWLASLIFKLFKLPIKLKDKAPKVFASRLGFAFVTLAFVFTFWVPTVSYVLAGILALLAFMDSILNYCVGCVIYSRLVLPYFKN